MITLPKEPPYRETHLLNRSAVWANEDYRGCIPRGGAKFLSLKQPALHIHNPRSPLPSVDSWPRPFWIGKAVIGTDLWCLCHPSQTDSAVPDEHHHGGRLRNMRHLA